MKPLVFAHRGGGHEGFEHSLAAYSKALDAGADGLECDVRLTRDGHLVCMHDWRVNRTSNGRGWVSKYSLDEINQLDFGPLAEESGQSPVVDDAHQVLTLARLLELVKDSSRPVRLLIETKHPTRWAGRVEKMLHHHLRRYGFDRPSEDDRSSVTVMSFSLMAMRRLADLLPNVPRAMLWYVLPPFYRTGSLPRGVGITAPRINIIRARPSYVAKAHAAGHRVFVWSVNEPDDVALMLDLGVDGIITDRPAMVTEAVAKRHQ